MRKLREDFRVGILGAAAGLFSMSVYLMFARIDAYYAYLSAVDTSYHTYDKPGADLWWIPIAIWHLLLFITASLVAHRHLATQLRSPFLLWQVIGISNVLGWGLTVFVVVSLECLMRGNLYPLERAMNPDGIADAAKYVSAIFACNVFYGSVMKASSRQYTAEFDELASGSVNAEHLLPTS